MADKSSNKDGHPWENAVMGHGYEDPETLLPHPLNPRTHPDEQGEAVEASIDALGWVKSVVFNRTTGRLLDGHLRVEKARERGEKVPVEYIELSEEQERLALALLDVHRVSRVVIGSLRMIASPSSHVRSIRM